MDVEPVLEGVLQRVDVGDMGEEAELDLAIVRADQDIAVLRDEGFADLAAFLGADRDILQVRVGRGEPARLRARHGVGRVDPLRLRVDRVLQRLGIG